MHQKLHKCTQRILQGYSTSSDLVIFDEAKAHFFKELAPYWTGFKFRIKEANGKLRFMTKQEKLLRDRLEEFIAMKNQSPNDFRLPELSARSKSATPTKASSNQVIPTIKHDKDTSLNIVFSIASGIYFKDERGNNAGERSHHNIHTNSTSNLNALAEKNDRRMSKVSRNSGSFLLANSKHNLAV
jgi:hypothetical protein